MGICSTPEEDMKIHTFQILGLRSMQITLPLTGCQGRRSSEAKETAGPGPYAEFARIRERGVEEYCSKEMQNGTSVRSSVRQLPCPEGGSATAATFDWCFLLAVGSGGISFLPGLEMCEGMV